MGSPTQQLSHMQQSKQPMDKQEQAMPPKKRHFYLARWSQVCLDLTAVSQVT